MLIRFLTLSMLVVLLLDTCNKCGPDVYLGVFPLADNSRQFIPYADDDVLVFVNQDGQTHTLKSSDGHEVTMGNILTVSTSCFDDDDDVAGQSEYYDTQRERITFEDEDGEPAFTCTLIVDHIGSIAGSATEIFDRLVVNPELFNNTYGAVMVITEEREGELPEDYLDYIRTRTTFVGDTLLYGRDFTEVYKSEHESGRAFYYNQYKGALAFTIDEDTFWVLDN